MIERPEGRIFPNLDSESESNWTESGRIRIWSNPNPVESESNRIRIRTNPNLIESESEQIRI